MLVLVIIVVDRAVLFNVEGVLVTAVVECRGASGSEAGQVEMIAAAACDTHSSLNGTLPRITSTLRISQSRCGPFPPLHAARGTM